MGNKTNPIALRVGIYREHDASWYSSNKTFAAILSEDMKIRKYIQDNLQAAVVTRVVIKRTRDIAEVRITCLKPSVIVGRKGVEINNISNHLKSLTGKEVRLRVFDIKRPEISAACIAREMANELKRRTSVKRVMKKIVQTAKRNGAIGVRVECSGRLSGAEIARREWYQEGAVPRQKLRADIDYAAETSFASWGTCGVKVWVYKGDILQGKDSKGSSNNKGVSR